MIHKILRIAQENPNGFTIRVPSLEPVTSGIAVAYWETQGSHDLTGLYGVLDHAKTHDGVIGGWQDPDTGQWYWDAVKVFDDSEIEEAIRFGKQHRQIAIYDLTSKRLIKL